MKKIIDAIIIKPITITKIRFNSYCLFFIILYMPIEAIIIPNKKAIKLIGLKYNKWGLEVLSQDHILILLSAYAKNKSPSNIYYNTTASSSIVRINPAS